MWWMIAVALGLTGSAIVAAYRYGVGVGREEVKARVADPENPPKPQDPTVSKSPLTKAKDNAVGAEHEATARLEQQLAAAKVALEAEKKRLEVELAAERAAKAKANEAKTQELLKAKEKFKSDLKEKDEELATVKKGYEAAIEENNRTLLLAKQKFEQAIADALKEKDKALESVKQKLGEAFEESNRTVLNSSEMLITALEAKDKELEGAKQNLAEATKELAVKANEFKLVQQQQLAAVKAKSDMQLLFDSKVKQLGQVQEQMKALDRDNFELKAQLKTALSAAEKVKSDGGMDKQAVAAELAAVKRKLVEAQRASDLKVEEFGKTKQELAEIRLKLKSKEEELVEAQKKLSAVERALELKVNECMKLQQSLANAHQGDQSQRLAIPKASAGDSNSNSSVVLDNNSLVNKLKRLGIDFSDSSEIAVNEGVNSSDQETDSEAPSNTRESAAAVLSSRRDSVVKSSPAVDIDQSGCTKLQRYVHEGMVTALIRTHGSFPELINDKGEIKRTPICMALFDEGAKVKLLGDDRAKNHLYEQRYEIVNYLLSAPELDLECGNEEGGIIQLLRAGRKIAITKPMVLYELEIQATKDSGMRAIEFLISQRAVADKTCSLSSLKELASLWKKADSARQYFSQYEPADKQAGFVDFYQFIEIITLAKTITFAILENKADSLEHAGIPRVKDAEIRRTLRPESTHSLSKHIESLNQMLILWDKTFGVRTAGQNNNIDPYWLNYRDFINSLQRILERYGVVLETQRFNVYQNIMLKATSDLRTQLLSDESGQSAQLSKAM